MPFVMFLESLSSGFAFWVIPLSPGHSYSRCKVKFNVHRVDNMIIQSIALLDQIDKDINTFSMRLRYSVTVDRFQFHISPITLNSADLQLSESGTPTTTPSLSR